MTTLTTDPRFAPNATPTPSGRMKRITSLARAEVKLLTRNRTALATGVLMGPLMAGFIAVLSVGAIDLDSSFGVYLIAVTLAWCALFTVYYNLTAIFVARRESRVFKRLATGEATSWDALVGSAVPSSGVMIAQLVLAAALAIVVFGVPALTNPLLAVVGVLGILVVCVALSAISTTFTSSVEAAQYSTFPIFMVLIFFSGAMFPLSVMAEWVQVVASYTPLYAASDLLFIGLSGANMVGESAGGFADSFALAAFPLAVLAGWVLLTCWFAGRVMRFDPRR